MIYTDITIPISASKYIVKNFYLEYPGSANMTFDSGKMCVGTSGVNPITTDFSYGTTITPLVTYTMIDYAKQHILTGSNLYMTYAGRAWSPGTDGPATLYVEGIKLA